MKFSFLAFFLLCSTILQAQDLQFLGRELKAVNHPVLKRTGGRTLVFAAPGETDLYIRPGVNYEIGNAPMYLFSTSENFVLEAKVKPSFKKRFDGGFLVVYSDKNNWGKFGSQKDHEGKKRAVSVITNEFSDTSNSLILNKSENHFKLEKLGNQLSFYIKKKRKKDWILLRQLLMTRTAPEFQVGFMAQSPMGVGCEVVFSEIRFKETESNLPEKKPVENEYEFFNEDDEPVVLTEANSNPRVHNGSKNSQLTHIVKRGETFYSISRGYGMSLERLLAINNTSSDQTLLIGKELLVEPVSEYRNIHVVQKGDTLYSISKKYGIKLEELKKKNRLERDVIDVGQRLLVSY